MQVAIHTTDAIRLESDNITSTIISACVQATSGESMNIIHWEVLNPTTIVADVIPLGDSPYKLTLLLNRKNKKTLYITTPEFRDDQCAVIKVKNQNGQITSYIEGSHLNCEIQKEFLVSV